MSALCECGCGAQLDRLDGRGRPRRFINGHHGRGKGERLRGPRPATWKADASYSAIHKWLNVHYEKTGVCGHCNRNSRTDYANVSGECRRDRCDYLELCRSCHELYDNRKESVGNRES